jgi:nicotinamide-nucleotide amidase
VDGADSTGARLVATLTAAGETIACAESLTAGLVAATIADTPGASLVLRGAVVAYAADVKSDLLGVPAELIGRVGTVDPAVAAAMAEGARDRITATWGVSTTGVAGPGPAEGKAAGTVHIAVAGPAGTATRALRLNGTRAQIRTATVEAVLALALDQAGATDQTDAPLTEARGTVGLSGPQRGGPSTDHRPAT